MSAGSQPIVIDIRDQIDPGIVTKLLAIGTASNTASVNLYKLQAALFNVNVATTALNATTVNLPKVLNQTASSTNRVTGAIAQLAARVVGAEAGVGMLGGAFGRVAVAAGLATPLIIAALAVGAVIGAILVYNKFEEAARKLVLAQIAVNQYTTHQNEEFLNLHETLVGLTQGPMAKYQAELDDIGKRAVDDDLTHLTKLIDEQKSHWADLVSWVERYAAALGALIDLNPADIVSFTDKFDLGNAKDFLNSIKEQRSELEDQDKGFQALQLDLQATGAKLIELHNLEQREDLRTLDNTEVARKVIQRHYSDLEKDLRNWYAKKAILDAGAAGETVALRQKAAREQLAQFDEELAQEKSKQAVFTHQQELDLRKQQLVGTPRASAANLPLAQKAALPLNVKPLTTDIGAQTQAVERQKKELVDLITKYDDATKALGAYSNEQKISIQFTTLLDEIEKRGLPITAKQKAELNDLVTARQTNGGMLQKTVSIYAELKGPELAYIDSINAINNLLHDQAISQDEANRATAQATNAFKNADNPLHDYLVDLQRETELLGVYGRSLDVVNQVSQIQLDLQRNGRGLSDDQLKALSSYLTMLNEQKRIQADVNQLVAANAEHTQDLIEHQIALNTAVDKQIISQQQYSRATAKTTIDIANQSLEEEKNATVKQQLVSAIGSYVDQLLNKGWARSIADVYGQAFATIADGAANSIGRAIVYAENLGEALKNVAREAVSQLISAFVKLAIQYVIINALGKIFHIQTKADPDTTKQTAKNLVVGLAAIAAITAAQLASFAALEGPAWALAEAVSLASFGANAAGAVTAIGLVQAAGAGALKFAAGGPVIGPRGIDRVPAWLTHGEYVVNAMAAKQNRPALDAINSGRSVGGSTNLSVQVVHDGSTSIDVQQIDEQTVRVIARREARNAVNEHAPGVVANDIQNPNSRMSKALSQSVVAPRKR